MNLLVEDIGKMEIFKAIWAQGKAVVIWMALQQEALLRHFSRRGKHTLRRGDRVLQGSHPSAWQSRAGQSAGPPPGSMCCAAAVLGGGLGGWQGAGPRGGGGRRAAAGRLHGAPGRAAAAPGREARAQHQVASRPASRRHAPVTATSQYYAW